MWLPGRGEACCRCHLMRVCELVGVREDPVPMSIPDASVCV